MSFTIIVAIIFWKKFRNEKAPKTLRPHHDHRYRWHLGGIHEYAAFEAAPEHA